LNFELSQLSAYFCLSLLVPTAVLDELKVSEERPGSQTIREAVSSGWIRSRDVSNEPLAQLLKQSLDRGEAEAIALAIELEADWILLDEREGRKAAKSLGLKVTGILGVLLRAKQLGELESLQPVIIVQAHAEQGIREMCQSTRLRSLE
jgi:uncharacterized protein